MPFGEIPIAITTIGPGDELAAAGLCQSPPPRAFENLGALLFSDHPLPLGQQFALRRIAEGVLQKDQWRVLLLEFLDQQPLMRLVAG
jgi:hypothetical protein